MNRNEFKVMDFFNHVKDNVVVRTFRIATIEMNGFRYFLTVLCDGLPLVSDEIIPMNEVKPILLTDDWITVNLEYKMIDTGDSDYTKVYHVHGQFIGYSDEFYYFIYPSFKGTFREVSVPIKYVHQLQNYYPAFSGKELSINGWCFD